MTFELTSEALSKAKFRGPVAFYDGRDGMARQDFECVDNERFGYAWMRKNRRDKGRQFYMVDGREVTGLDEACRLLALDPDPNSPAEIRKRDIDEFRASPSLDYGPYRALSEARCNADGGPFGMIRAWLRRADNPWHVGINAYGEEQRNAGKSFDWYRWLYNVKSAGHESYRAMYLFEMDRKKDAGLECAYGVRCRDCPILQTIERSMIGARTREPFPSQIDDSDIDAAKTWTCIGHILTGGTDIHDGQFFSIEEHRKHGLF